MLAINLCHSFLYVIKFVDNETLLQWQQPQDSNDNSKEIGNAQLVPFEDNLIEMLFKNKSSKELQSGDSSFTNLEPVSSKIIIKENELDKVIRKYLSRIIVITLCILGLRTEGIGNKYCMLDASK